MAETGVSRVRVSDPAERLGPGADIFVGPLVRKLMRHGGASRVTGTIPDASLLFGEDGWHRRRWH